MYVHVEQPPVSAFSSVFTPGAPGRTGGDWLCVFADHGLWPRPRDLLVWGIICTVWGTPTSLLLGFSGCSSAASRSIPMATQKGEKYSQTHPLLIIWFTSSLESADGQVWKFLFVISHYIMSRTSHHWNRNCFTERERERGTFYIGGAVTCL